MLTEIAWRHWLALVNTVAAAFVSLPVIAPLLLAAGHTSAANLIYAAYRNVCHQWAFRSYFLLGAESTYSIERLRGLVGVEQMFGFLGNAELGYKVAFCERDLAIYLSVLIGGLVYARKRNSIRALGLIGYAALISPMALDGFTQLFGWRESTAELRIATGALFGVASVWLFYPRVDRVFESRATGQDYASMRVPNESRAVGLRSAESS